MTAVERGPSGTVVKSDYYNMLYKTLERSALTLCAGWKVTMIIRCQRVCRLGRGGGGRGGGGREGGSRGGWSDDVLGK